jgi:sensor domain CHASE-containing protein
MVLIPEPDDEEGTSQPVASSGVHLTVTPFTRLNPGGVLPFAIGVPVVVLVSVFLVLRLRRRSIDAGGKQ